MQYPSRSSVPPRRVDLLDRTPEGVDVPWPVRVIADGSAPRMLRRGPGVVVDCPDRPTTAALSILRKIVASGEPVTLRLFASWDSAGAASTDGTLAALCALPERILVGSRAHLVHLSSRGAFGGAGEIRIETPAPVLPGAGRSVRVLDCRFDREPAPGADAVARSRDAFERELPGAGVVLLSHARPFGGSALIDGLLESGRMVVASGVAAATLEGARRPRLVLVEDGALDAEWLRSARAA